MTIAKIEKLYTNDDNFIAKVNGKFFLAKQIGDVVSFGKDQYFWKAMAILNLTSDYKEEPLFEDLTDYLIME